MKLFYSVGNLETSQGLWYDQKGKFTGLIHDEYSFCENFDLPMPYDENVVGWLSATKTLEELYQWFTKEDIIKLQEHNYFITSYEVEKYKYHNNHWLICQKTSILKNKIIL